MIPPGGSRSLVALQPCRRLSSLSTRGSSRPLARAHQPRSLLQQRGFIVICNPTAPKLKRLQKPVEERVIPAEEDKVAILRKVLEKAAATPAVETQSEKSPSKAEEEALLKAEEDAKLKAEEDAKLKAEEDAKLKAKEEAQLKAEEDARLMAEAEAKAKAEEEARI